MSQNVDSTERCDGERRKLEGNHFGEEGVMGEESQWQKLAEQSRDGHLDHRLLVPKEGLLGTTRCTDHDGAMNSREVIVQVYLYNIRTFRILSRAYLLIQ